MAEGLKFDVGDPDSIAAQLTQAGWAGAPVEAASMVRQGHSPSIASAAIGVGLFKLFGSKGAKELPRTFVLAVAGDRVVAFDAGGVSEEDSNRYTLTIKPGELGAWPREQVAMAPAKKGMTANADCVLGDKEVRLSVPDSTAEPAFEKLVATLSPS
jgi:hypothetical protein